MSLIDAHSNEMYGNILKKETVKRGVCNQSYTIIYNNSLQISQNMESIWNFQKLNFNLNAIKFVHGYKSFSSFNCATANRKT